MEQATRNRRLLPAVQWTAYWELLRNLSLKNIKVKSRRTLLGLFWSVLQPAALIMVYYFAFGVVIGVTPVPNYPLYIALGIVHWVFFTGIINQSTTVVASSAGILDKVAFPRLVLPASVVLSHIVELGFALVAFTALFVPLGGTFWWGMWVYFPVVALATAFFAGIAMAAAALGALFRDLAQLVPIVLRVAFFASPVLYRFDRLPEHIQSILGYSPFAVYLDGVRFPLYENTFPTLESWALMVGYALVSVVVGYAIFARMRDRFTEWL